MPVQYIKGVGPQRAQMLSKAAITTVEDMLLYQPFRYEDRSNYVSILDLTEGQEAVLEAEVVTAGIYTTPMKRVRIFEMIVRDTTGVLPVKFFNQPYLEKVFRKGKQVVLYGVPRRDEYSGQLCLINPEHELVGAGETAAIHTGRVVPVYRKIGRLQSRALRQIVFQILEELEEGTYEELLPGPVVEKFGFPSRSEALKQVHFPVCPAGKPAIDFLADLEARRTPAQQRLIFEEFFLFQLGLKAVKKRRQLVPKERKIEVNKRIREVIKAILPFHPTTAQKRVLKEIVEDLTSLRPMSRLLQGDVGSGKTIVAVQAMVVVMENGFQAVLMAPTEILAEQHYRTVADTLSATGHRVVLLTGKLKGKQRKTVLAEIQSGEAQLVVGTHAVFQKGIQFKDLGMVVVDEQHRFGVLQRSQLMEKGGRPDTLVMTATPIPRSLAMTVYGDLDLSLIDELPPGRRSVQTSVHYEMDREKVYAQLRQQLAKGRQIFVVYPLVEQSEKVDLRAATEMSEYLRKNPFRQYRVGLLHGRLRSEEKEDLMEAFVSGRIHILVATTVIEVGIDVPNATVMVVEHADRFGLSQLHQLRGRIGRGSYQSYCILMTEGPGSAEAIERLDIMRRTNDGFRIAEKDLEIRGPGDFVGTRQSGFPSFAFANIVRDRKWLLLAESEAAKHFRKLSGNLKELDAQLSRLRAEWRERFGLYEVG